MDLATAAAALEGSSLGIWMRSSAVAYPLANLLHLLGLVLLIGGIGVVDLRLIGFGRKLPLAPLTRFLRPFAVLGLALLLSSGAMLFAADAVPLARALLFGWKLAVIALALANALAFEALWRGTLSTWEGTPPRPARLMAAFSIALWLTAAALGRLLAYF